MEPRRIEGGCGSSATVGLGEVAGDARGGGREGEFGRCGDCFAGGKGGNVGRALKGGKSVKGAGGGGKLEGKRESNEGGSKSGKGPPIVALRPCREFQDGGRGPSLSVVAAWAGGLMDMGGGRAESGEGAEPRDFGL